MNLKKLYSQIIKEALSDTFKEGDILVHKHNPDDYQIELISKNANGGWKVNQSEKRGNKTVKKIANYKPLDFDKDKGIWVKK